jgi:hypothetical protein
MKNRYWGEGMANALPIRKLNNHIEIKILKMFNPKKEEFFKLWEKMKKGTVNDAMKILNKVKIGNEYISDEIDQLLDFLLRS